jgi:hypothetical protein
MGNETVPRKDLDSQKFLQIRQATEKISSALETRLKGHLNVLRPLFIARKLFGNFVESSDMREVPRSDKAFAELQEKYASICGNPFDLPKKLQAPIPPISNQLEITPMQYMLRSSGSGSKGTKVTCPTKWILSYRSDCPVNRLRAMLEGKETRQADDMRQCLVDHLALVIFFQYYPGLTQLFEDLRYDVETMTLADLGGLPVVVFKAPIETFLPPDEFIQQVTQLSGIPAFQEIIDLEELENISDPLKEMLKESLA